MSKYDSLRKTERNKKIRRLHLKHPELSLQEIADKFKITRQRVWVILKVK